jgi:hypothetical protein
MKIVEVLLLSPLLWPLVLSIWFLETIVAHESSGEM